MSFPPSRIQVSAGGVAFQKQGEEIQIVLISVGQLKRWQLPKGQISPWESIEAAAQREVREEGGIETELLGLIDTIEYWYYSGSGEKRVRYHKFVHFYLLRYRSGNVLDHDAEVNEAIWMEIDQALDMLAFKSERSIVEKAKTVIRGMNSE
jgi:8-oxo-dGTP diphosphatase